MLDILTKLIPFIQSYPTWLQQALASWIIVAGGSGVIIIALFILTPSRTLVEEHTPQAPPTPVVKVEPKSSGSRNSIEQKTQGDNSPAISGVSGDVNIKIEQQKNAK